MKIRSYILLILTISFITFSNAQIRVGIQGGLNIASFTIPNNLISNAERNSLLAFSIGGIGELAVSNLFYLQIEPRYIQKGFITEISEFAGTSKSTESVNYFELPLYVKAKFCTKNFQPFILVGPNFGFLLSASEEATLFTGQTLPKLDTKVNYKSYDLAIDFGVGVEYVLTEVLSLHSSVRYSLGIANVYDIPTYDYKTRGIQIYIGILYGFN